MAVELPELSLDAERVRSTLADTARPYVSLKAAATLDGKIATRSGESKWITGPAARALGHRLRALHQGIVVGIGTVLADDPQLTVREPGDTQGQAGAGQPARIVLDSTCRTPPAARWLNADGAQRILVCGNAAPGERTEALGKLGVTILRCGTAQPKPAEFLPALRRAGLQTLLAEGGSRVIATLIAQGAANALFLFLSGKVMGDEAAPGWCGALGDARALASLPRVRLLPPLLVEGDVLLRGVFETE